MMAPNQNMDSNNFDCYYCFHPTLNYCPVHHPIFSECSHDLMQVFEDSSLSSSHHYESPTDTAQEQMLSEDYMSLPRRLFNEQSDSLLGMYYTSRKSVEYDVMQLKSATSW